MITIAMLHEVKNYSDWKKGFDADAPMRSKMGVNIVDVYQSAHNPNKVAVFTEMASMEALKGLMSNPDLKVAMEHAGVIGMPEIKILNNM